MMKSPGRLCLEGLGPCVGDCVERGVPCLGLTEMASRIRVDTIEQLRALAASDLPEGTRVTVSDTGVCFVLERGPAS